MKIMLVDDSRMIRNIQKGVLRQLGYKDFVEATDGQDALRQVFSAEPDLILLDWDMPIMDGQSFVKAFRQKDTATPVIMVAAEAERQRIADAMESGVNNYVVKPFTTDALRATITQTLAKVAA